MVEVRKNPKAPLVSVCCITYNEELFIRRCLDGFLMQKAPSCVSADAGRSDWMEILIRDDASTDGTADIIREYEAKYPDVIFAICDDYNMYQHGQHAQIDFPNYTRARGKYIAYCEGDDYWTDPQKLQKQVDFMEEHADCAVCFTDFENFDCRNDMVCANAASALLKHEGIGENGCLELSKEDYFRSWVTMPLTMLFRQSMFDIHWRECYKYYRDQHEIYHLLKQGKCYILNFVSGRRNIHEGGVSGPTTSQQNAEDSLIIAEELYRVNRDKYTREYYVRTLRWAMNYCRKWSGKRIHFALKAFYAHPNFSMFIRDLKR